MLSCKNVCVYHLRKQRAIIILFSLLRSIQNPTGGRWSAWSEWSTCTSECIRIRRRACLASADATSQTAAAYGGGDASGHLVADKTACSGRDIQTDECRGGNCSLGGNGINNNTGEFNARELGFICFFFRVDGESHKNECSISVCH